MDGHFLFGNQELLSPLAVSVSAGRQWGILDQANSLPQSGGNYVPGSSS
jgi:hypothetical protein